MDEASKMQALEQEIEFLKIRLAEAEAWRYRLLTVIFLMVVGLPIIFMR